MLHFWLIPALVILVMILAGFYAMVRNYGGSGIRTDGKTVLHKPTEESDLPPD